ncbi:MAG: hypothetical protein WCN92_09485, partial [Eubacteriales bacterium]
EVNHVACPYGSDYNAFVLWLLEQKSQPTVWTDARYPQFSGTNDDGRTLYPLTKAPAIKPSIQKVLLSVFDTLLNIKKSLSAFSF